MKGVGLNLQSQSHYIDHLAPICVLMSIPLLFTDEQQYSAAKGWYPELNAQHLPVISREYIIQNYDLLFLSDLWDRRSFHEKYASLENQYRKQIRHVHCPHGFSDKGFYLRKCADEDIVLVYGRNMLDLLKSEGVLEQLPYYVLTGNVRYFYFKKHQHFYNELFEKEIQPHFAKQQPIILYAPTWKDQEDSTSFFDATQYLLDHLPDQYNMIVKVHPQLETQETVDYYQIVGKYDRKPNILFLKEFSPIYSLLARTDIYIGDMSSIGYDFLVFNKPMFFLNQQRRHVKSDRRTYLFRCGVEVKPDAYPLIYRLIEANLPGDFDRFGKIREETYAYTFGEECSSEQIKADILSAAQAPYIP